jgi:hypothetical protein
MIIACILLAVMIRASQSRDIFWILAWPGTVVHEVLHYTVGFMLGARPTEISVIPDRAESNTIGYVNFDNLNWFNALPTAMAPLLAFPIAWWATTVIPLDWSVAGCFWLWVVSAVIAQAWPSTVDFAMGTKKIMGVVFWAAVVYLLFVRG